MKDPIRSGTYSEESTIGCSNIVQTFFAMMSDAWREFLDAKILYLLDAIAFTGGIGENSFRIREQVCQGLDSLGIQMDLAANASNTSEISERNIAERRGSVSLWIVPTNEELVVARQAFDLLISEGRKGV